eukprot:scaffold16935_cov185-Amphora_coffeaeformis.AAC.3
MGKKFVVLVVQFIRRQGELGLPLTDLPVDDKMRRIFLRSSAVKLGVHDHTVMPCPIVAGVLGMLRTILEKPPC